MAIWTEGREKPSGVEGRWQTSEESEQKCMQRGEPYERTYRRGDRSINTEAFTAEGGRREDQGAATLKGLPRGGGRSEQYPKAFGFGGEKNSGGYGCSGVGEIKQNYRLREFVAYVC